MYFSELDKKEQLRILDKYDAEDSLASFIKQGWKYIDPQPYVHGWHLDAICEHLMAVSAGEIKRLLINIPPRSSKSSVCSVGWPAWTWIQQRRNVLTGPEVQFMSVSYAATLSERDSTKMRRLIDSEWYQDHWGDRFSFAPDQNAKRKFENTAGGYRLATSLTGTQTGDGGIVVLIDDPMSAGDANSDVERANVLRWWTETLPTRLNDAKNGAIVVIMQRLHQEDLSGHIIENDTNGDWCHLNLPMRYDSGSHCSTFIGWEDPRTFDGELLCPGRYGEKEVRDLERDLGSYASAAQLQQMPAPKGGGIIKRENWQLYPPADWEVDDDKPLTFPKFEYILASVDTAYTEKQENDFSACTVWGVWRDKGNLPRLMLVEAWNERLEFNALKDKIIDTAKRRKIDCLLIEGKASGLSVYQEVKRLCADEDFSIYAIPPIGDKVTRVHTCQPLFENGSVFAPDRKYVDTVISQFEMFPKGKHDDLVDSSTQAINYMRKVGLALLSDEGAKINTSTATYQPQQATITENYGV